MSPPSPPTHKATKYACLLVHVPTAGVVLAAAATQSVVAQDWPVSVQVGAAAKLTFTTMMWLDNNTAIASTDLVTNATYVWVRGWTEVASPIWARPD